MASIPVGDFAMARAIPKAQERAIDMRYLEAGRGAQALAQGVNDIGGAMLEVERQKQQQADALASAEANVEVQRRSNAASGVLAEWVDRASRPGYDLSMSDEDIRQSLEAIGKKEIVGLSPDRKVLYDGALKNIDDDIALKAGAFRKSVYANRAEAAFSAGTEELGMRATDLSQDIEKLYANADAMGAAASANLPVDTVQAKVRVAKEAISAARIGTRLASAQTLDDIDALEKDIGGDKYVLDGTKKASYLSSLATKRNTMQNKLENERLARDRSAERAVNELQAIGKSGFPPRQEDVASLVEKTRGTEFEQDAAQAVAMIDLNKAFYTMPLAEAEAQVSDIEKYARRNPEGNRDAPFIKSALSAAQGIVAERKALAQKNPVEAMVADTGVRFDPLAFENPNVLAGQIRERMDKVEAYRKQQGIRGIPSNPFTESEQLEFNERILKAPNDQIRTYLLSAVAKAADGPGEFKQVMAQVKQNSPLNYAVGEVLSLAPPGAERIAADIYRGQQVIAGKALPLPSAEIMRSFYAEQVGAALDPASDEYKNGLIRFTNLYASRATADTGKDYIDEEISQWAMEAATGGVVSTDYGQVVKPWGMSEESFTEKLEPAMWQAVTAAGADISDLDGYKLMPRPDANGQYYLVGPDGITETRPNTQDPIIVKIK